MRTFGIGLLLSVSVGVLAPGVAAAIETHGTYYSKPDCQDALWLEQKINPRHDVLYCASNGGPASSSQTTWTLYSD